MIGKIYPHKNPRENLIVYEQCIVTKEHFPANKGRIKKATNGHIGAIGLQPSLSFSRKGEHSRYITALYKDRDRVPVCFLD